MSDCGGEEEKRESSLESSCQSKTDQSEDLSILPVFSDEPGPSHSRLIKDAGEVGSMSTVGPPSATDMRKRWHENMTQNLRDFWVHKLVCVLPLTPDREVDARKIEGDIYESANSIDEYYRLLREKINKLEEEEKWTQQRLSLDLESTSRSQSSIRQPPYDSDLSLDPRTKLHQSADKTEVNSPSPWARTREATHSLIKDAGGVGSMSTAGPPSATGMRKRWHDDMMQDLRDLWVRSLVRVLRPTPDREVDARKIEGDIYESANSIDEYYRLLREKINKLEEEEERAQQRLSLDLESTSRSQSLIRQPPDSRLPLGSRTKVHQSADKTEDEYYHLLIEKIIKILEEKRRKQQRPSLDLGSTSMDPSSIRQPPYSFLSLDPNTVLDLSADKTEVNSPSPWARTGEATHSLIKDAGEVGSMSTVGPPSATGMRKRWHEDMTQDLRDLWVRSLVDVLPLTPDREVDARKIEGDIYESANSIDEYYHLLREKIIKIQEEKRTQQSLSLDLRSTSRSQSPIRQPPYSFPSLDPNTVLDLSADKTEDPSSSGGHKRRRVISSSTGRSPYQERPLNEEQSPSQHTTEDDSHLTLSANTRQDEDETEASSHFTPELSNESGAISYRFSCPGPGVFQCKLTKLVFTMDREGELSYRTVQWDESHLQSAGKRPAGPLFDIKCPEDAVSKLHLPHCEIKPAPLCLSVVHISDDGMSFLEPLEITDTHVVVDVPHLSAFGLVLETIKRFFSPNPEPIRGQVLLFHRPAYMRQRPKLNVFLLPDNVPVPEVKAQQEKAEYIEAPSSCELIEGQTYSLHCSEAFKIQPESARFDLNYGPNYHKTFEIRLTPSTDEATVTVQDQEKRQVWNYHAELPGPDQRRENLQKTKILSGDEEERLRSVRTEFIKRVSIPVLNNLLDALLQDNIINHGEKDWIKEKHNRADKAQELIDMVLNKGNQACKTLIDTFCKEDKCLSAMLQLQQS